MPNIRVAAVQSKSVHGDPAHNLTHLAPLVAQAKSGGARLVLLPEFISTGFEINSKIWQCAEPSSGMTVQWLIEQALAHEIWIGTSFLEAVDDHFYNSFVLISPQGEEVMRVRKSRPAASETYLFEGFPSPRVVQTPLGRIGVVICYEGFFAATIRELYQEGADFVLMPMSAPTPSLNAPLTRADLLEYDQAVANVAPAIARELGVPVIMANKAGAWKTTPPKPFPVEDSTYPGLSTIAAADGTILASLQEQEGVICADITLQSEAKVKAMPTGYGKWARKPPSLFKLFIIAETLGRISYLLSRKRRRMARSKSAPLPQ